MGNYGKTLPATGGLILGGTAIGYPWIAVGAAALGIAGFFVKPARVGRR
jgi:hypothetical protein